MYDRGKRISHDMHKAGYVINFLPPIYNRVHTEISKQLLKYILSKTSTYLSHLFKRSKYV
jgi:hypothetical protein